MLTGKPPGQSVSTPRFISQLLAEGSIHDIHRIKPPAVLKAFLNRVFQKDARSRPTAEWLLKKDPFINEDMYKNYIFLSSFV